jgi:hypothetical protein
LCRKDAQSAGKTASPNERSRSDYEGGESMLNRRSFVTSTLGAGAALTMQRVHKAAAQADRRMVVDAQIHLWKPESEDWKWVPGLKPQLPVDGVRSRQRSAIGWFVGDGEKTRCFSAVRSDANGTKRTYRDDLLLVRFRATADIHARVASTASVVNDPLRS